MLIQCEWRGVEKKGDILLRFLWLFVMYTYIFYFIRKEGQERGSSKIEAFLFVFVMLIYSYISKRSAINTLEKVGERDWTEIKWIGISIEIQFIEQILLPWWYKNRLSSLSHVSVCMPGSLREPLLFIPYLIIFFCVDLFRLSFLADRAGEPLSLYFTRLSRARVLAQKKSAWSMILGVCRHIL